MKTFAGLVIAALALAPVSRVAHAQFSTQAVLGSGDGNTAHCFDNQFNATAECVEQDVPGGTGSAYASVNPLGKSFSLVNRLSNGGLSPIDEVSLSVVGFEQWLYINGVVQDGDRLVLHFFSSEDIGFENAGAESQSGAQFDFNLQNDWNDSMAEHYVSLGACGCNFGVDDGFVNLGGGYMDAYLDLAGSSDEYFVVTGYIANTLFLTEEANGATGHSNFGIQLLGANAVNASNGQIGTVTFDEDGVGQLDFDTTPEPASLVFIGTGLLALGGYARRRGTQAA